MGELIYREDQWSPHNPEGKRQCDRHFLLYFQNQRFALTKPNNLPNLDIVKDRARLHLLPQSYCKVKDPLVLKADLQELQFQVCKILSTLRFNKLRNVAKSIRKLDINTEIHLSEIVDQILEMAIDEPDIRALYADLCICLTSIAVPLESKRGQVDFRKLLLQKCRRKLEELPVTMLIFREWGCEARMEVLETADIEKKKELWVQMEVEERTMHMRQIGIMLFFGQLFKSGMIEEHSVHACIKKLLNQGNEESLECLCVLLEIVGEKLDMETGNKKHKVNNEVDKYFAEMREIADRQLITARVSSMFQRIIDLKQNNWDPKKGKKNFEIKTAQIHTAEEEALMSE